MLNNPALKPEPQGGLLQARFAVSSDHSRDYETGINYAYAWFRTFQDALKFSKGTTAAIWDRETGALVVAGGRYRQ